ncbi:MAG TPA: hypothetical protein H9784_00425 [Candidatus Desulfovibrio intestinavium]|uniref:Uncharacterized protein n=1 Tax=Candidatus Desulfovibrio intestinavium TaxID=2838534 RepID=A0A9D2HJS3_9BACT|nr:hypothetical protein [Candidatus Desulfovibrio intestinavium]
MSQPTIAQLERRLHQLEQALQRQLSHHEQLCGIVLRLQERLIARNDAALAPYNADVLHALERGCQPVPLPCEELPHA